MSKLLINGTPKIFIDGQECTAFTEQALETVGDLLADLVMMLEGSQKIVREVSIDGIVLTEAILPEIAQREATGVGTIELKTMTYQELARLALDPSGLPPQEAIRQVQQSVETFRSSLQECEGAITYLREAERRLRAGDGVNARQSQADAFAIITDLMSTVSHQVGGAIGANLHRLYAFMLQHLSEGNTRRDPQYFNDVAWLLTVLYDAFAQAVGLAAQRDTLDPQEAVAGAR